MESTAAQEAPVEAAFTFKDEILVVGTKFDWYRDLIETAERLNKWDRASITNSHSTAPAYQHQDRNNDVLTISGLTHPDLEKFEAVLRRLTGQVAGLYKALNKHLPVNRDTNFQLLRYKPGQHFHEHIDNIAGHPDWGQRQLSSVLYLNDDYVGGEIDFPRQKRKIKPVAGDLVMFPSFYTHPHASLDVASGTKWAVVTWFV